MKKLLLSLAAFLFVSGVAFAGLQINPATGKLDKVGGGSSGGAVGIGTISPGVTNFHSKYTSSYTLDDSALIFDNGTNVGIGTITTSALLTVNGVIKGTNLYSDVTNKNYGLANSALLTRTTGTDNTAMGWNALAGVTTGLYNTCIGSTTCVNVTNSQYTTAVGINSIGIGTNSGIKNSAFGGNTLNLNTTGTLNTAIGYHSTTSNTTGSYNTGLGVDSLHANISGDNNVALGYLASYNNTTSSENTAVGNDSLTTNLGAQNTALGRRSGGNLLNGSQNTYIGYQSGYNNSYKSTTNQILLGYNTSSNYSNVAQIGNSSITGVSIGHGSPSKTLSFSGQAARTIGMERHTSSSQNGNSLTINAGGSSIVGLITTLSGTPTAGGTGYVVDDIVTISTGNADATAVITAVGGSGDATAVILVAKGSGYSTGTGQATTGGTGSGLTVNITGVATALNKSGGDLNLSSGTSTGTGSSAVRILTATASGSGSADNAPSEKVTILGSGNVGISSTNPGATLDLGTGNLRVGIGTTTAGTVLCVKSISSGTAIMGYCTGSLTNSICGTCN